MRNSDAAQWDGNDFLMRPQGHLKKSPPFLFPIIQSNTNLMHPPHLTRIRSVNKSPCTYVCTHVLAITNSDFAGKSSAIIPFGEHRTCAIVLFWLFMSCYIVMLLCSWKERYNKNCLCLITRQKKCNVVVLRAFPKCFADCLRLFLFFGLHHYGVASDHL